TISSRSESRAPGLISFSSRTKHSATSRLASRSAAIWLSDFSLLAMLFVTDDGLEESLQILIVLKMNDQPATVSPLFQVHARAQRLLEACLQPDPFGRRPRPPPGLRHHALLELLDPFFRLAHVQPLFQDLLQDG